MNISSQIRLFRQNRRIVKLYLRKTLVNLYLLACIVLLVRKGGLSNNNRGNCLLLDDNFSGKILWRAGGFSLSLHLLLGK